MKKLTYVVLSLGFLSLVACSKNKRSDDELVQQHHENLRILNQKMTEQEKFIEEAKKVLAEHRAHIVTIENELAKLTGAKKPAKGKAR